MPGSCWVLCADTMLHLGLSGCAFAQLTSGAPGLRPTCMPRPQMGRTDMPWDTTLAEPLTALLSTLAHWADHIPELRTVQQCDLALCNSGAPARWAEDRHFACVVPIRCSGGRVWCRANDASESLTPVPFTPIVLFSRDTRQCVSNWRISTFLGELSGRCPQKSSRRKMVWSSYQGDEGYTGTARP